jgi:hypothetical protein
MENVIAVIVVILFLAGIMLFAKRFVKPPKGKLPDCCGPEVNRNVGLQMRQNRFLRGGGGVKNHR